MKIKILKWIVYICLYLVLVTPLLVWGKLLFPYISPKVFFFRIVIEIALFFYILLAFSCSKYRPKFSRLTYLILIYLFLITIASIFGVDFYHSFWSDIERGEGLLTIYHLFIFFILITSLFKREKDWFRFFNISIIVSLLVSLYALGQKFELSFLLQSAGGSRLSSTIGNASFLASYLLIHIFLCFFFLYKKSKNWRIFYGLIILFEIYIILQTGTRGAMLGLLGGLILIAFLSILFSSNKKIKLSSIGLFLILIILAGSIWFCQEQSWVQNNSILSRVTSISTTDTTTQSRLLAWQASWHGWSDKFILGYGYENFNVAFNKYFPVLIYRDSGSQIWFDRAHNTIIDQAVTGGILGLLAYLSIFVFVFWIILRKIWLLRVKNNKTFYHSLEAIILFSLLSVYFFQNLFVFDTLSSYILFYSILGFIIYLYDSKKNQKIILYKSKDKHLKIFPIIILSFFCIFFIYFFNIRPLLANTISVKGLSYAQNNMYREAMHLFKKSLSYQTNQSPEIRCNLVKLVEMAYQSNQFSQRENKENFNYAIEEINKNLELSPLNVRYYLFAMTLYNSAAKLDPNYYDKVIEIGYRAIELSPTRPQIYFAMGQAKIFQGKYQEGIDYFKKAVELNPTVIESHWNLAATYVMVGQEELAEKEFSKLKEIGFDYYSVENLQKLSNIYRRVGQIEKARELEQYLEN